MMPDRTITALFDRRDDAEGAVQALLADAGLRRDHVKIEDSSSLEPGSDTGGTQERGFLASLREFFVPDDDAKAFAEGARRGGVVVSAQVAEAQADSAADILERHGAVDLDERATEWRGSGWTDDSDDITTPPSGNLQAMVEGPGAGMAEAQAGIDPGLRHLPSDQRGLGGGGMSRQDTVDASDHRGLGAEGMGVDAFGGARRDATATDGTIGEAVLGSSSGSDRIGTGGIPAGTMAASDATLVGGMTSAAARPEPLAADVAGQGGRNVGQPGATRSDEQAIPLAEETLRVGKRVVQGGRVRVRSYVIETPVQERVTLRDERVEVERRPINRAADASAGDLFAERSIEAEERQEEAVIAKDVRIREEVVLKRESEERTETIDETVRRTEVEIEHDASTTETAPGSIEPALRDPGIVAGDATRVRSGSV